MVRARKLLKRRLRFGAFMLLAWPLPCGAACSDLLPTTAQVAAPSRKLQADDLLRLRDIGIADSSMVRQKSPLGLSPDGRTLAFILRHADPDTNNYCMGLVRLDLHGAAPPQLLDLGGEPMLIEFDVEGGRMTAGGLYSPAPRWSPDGKAIAYLRRDRGVTQLWVVSAGGGDARPITKGAVDVEDFAWDPDRRHILFGSRPQRREIGRAVDVEGKGGWLYDDRIAPQVGPRPRPSGATPVVVTRIALDGLPAGGKSNADLLNADDAVEESPLPSTRTPDGRRAWIAQVGAGPLARKQLFAAMPDGRPTPCETEECARDILQLWWDRSGGEIRFLRREGWARDHMAIYGWRPGSKDVRLIRRTEDVLLGCLAGGEGLICLSENSTTPRHIVTIDLVMGAVRTLFDPNPEFGAIRLGAVQRLRWRNDRKLEAWGDLVLPPHYRAGDKLPLIIVQYHSDGFLRGGTGDEYPIQLFAAHGFAVLSLERPGFAAEAVPGLKSWDEFNAANMKNWAERWNLLSSLMTGIDKVIALDIVDPKRIGITGLSDGASTARFALINRPIFAAAAISSCCFDPAMTMMQAGTAFADKMQSIGLPSFTRPDPDYWRPYAFPLNAAKLDRPLLMQLADEEYSLALESFTALREQGQPVEMRIFPGEYHVKWQPAHRRAIYSRNLDWFSYWLQARRDPDPAKGEQYARWDMMRDCLAKRQAGALDADQRRKCRPPFAAATP